MYDAFYIEPLIWPILLKLILVIGLPILLVWLGMFLRKKEYYIRINERTDSFALFPIYLINFWEKLGRSADENMKRYEIFDDDGQAIGKVYRKWSALYLSLYQEIAFYQDEEVETEEAVTDKKKLNECKFDGFVSVIDANDNLTELAKISKDEFEA